MIPTRNNPALLTFRDIYGRQIGQPIRWIVPLPAIDELCTVGQGEEVLVDWKVVRVDVKAERVFFENSRRIDRCDFSATVYLSNLKGDTPMAESEVEEVPALRDGVNGFLNEVHPNSALVQAFKYGSLLYETEGQARHAKLLSDSRSDLIPVLIELLRHAVGDLPPSVVVDQALGHVGTIPDLGAALAERLIRDDTTEPTALTHMLWSIHGRGARPKPPRYS